MKIDWGPKLFKKLNGVFCIYKPSDIPAYNCLETIKLKLANECNALPCFRYERKIQRTPPNSETTVPVSLDTLLPQPTDNLARHRLALGPRYLPEDFDLVTGHRMSRQASGIIVVGLGSGRKYVQQISSARFLRVYHVQGRLGYSTHDFSPTGRVIERTTFHHVKRTVMDKICAKCQASHTKHMFVYAGVQPDSQEAYELASSGLIRPENAKTPPILYGVRCIEFNPPDFKLEIHSINENSHYFMELIHDIGLQLRTTAICAHIRRIRFGHFQLEHTLLRKHWDAENILENIKLCRQFLTEKNLMTDDGIRRIGHEPNLLELENGDDFTVDRKSDNPSEIDDPRTH